MGNGDVGGFNHRNFLFKGNMVILVAKCIDIGTWSVLLKELRIKIQRLINSKL